MAKNPTPPALGARERILQTAHDLFYREGIRATGVDRLIAESGVAKLTFYRHFPSKNALVMAFLDHRHRYWMDWFTSALERHGGNADALVPTLAEWFSNPEYRGCAFINTVSELACDLPEVAVITHRHKADMTKAIAGLLLGIPQRGLVAEALAVAVDGTIIRAQYDPTPKAALAALQRIIKALTKSPSRSKASPSR